MSECVTKFRGRYGWTHRDIVRLCHLKSANVGNDGLCCEMREWDWGCDAVSSGLVVLDISKDCITFIFRGEGVLLDCVTHEDEGTTFL
jgi:hypothetical protein